uniref:Uncharacterized protein n=1 Tax=Psilocybe cubensis TaxID=181762 RepID=A0A8H7XN07_PSICU
MPPPNHERLYVDLIFRSSRKYPNWDPEVTIQVGDYGRITQGKRGLKFWMKNRGTFLKEGNIYKEGLAKQYEIPEAVEHGAAATEGITWITSKNARDISVEANVAEQTPALVECGVKAAFKFTSGRGAVLAMNNDTISTIDPPGKLRHLLAEPTMKGLVIVSEVHRCSSYARFLSTQNGVTVALGLSAEPPIANVGKVGTDVRWVHSSSAGNFKAKVDKTGKRVFCPLFRLVALVDDDVASGLRGEMDQDPPLPDALPPWDPIEDAMEQEEGDLTASPEEGTLPIGEKKV